MVGIYQLSKGYETWWWPCEKHLAAKKRDGFEVKERRSAPHLLTCDVCKKELSNGK